jgi:hypothetical protein
MEEFCFAQDYRGASALKERHIQRWDLLSEYTFLYL